MDWRSIRVNRNDVNSVKASGRISGRPCRVAVDPVGIENRDPHRPSGNIDAYKLARSGICQIHLKLAHGVSERHVQAYLALLLVESRLLLHKKAEGGGADHQKHSHTYDQFE